MWGYSDLKSRGDKLMVVYGPLPYHSQSFVVIKYWAGADRYCHSKSTIICQTLNSNILMALLKTYLKLAASS